MKKNFRYKICPLSFLLFISFVLVGQDLKFYTPPGKVSQNSITNIIQDDNGFLWFGTRYGANRYNGLEFKTFLSAKENKLGLRNDAINCFLNDSERNLWIGTLGGGITIFNIDLQNFNTSHNKTLESLNSEQIGALFMDSRKNIWIGTIKSGLKLLEKGSKHLKHFFSEVDDQRSLPSNHIVGIGEDKNGNIVISTWGGGISIYNYERNIFTNYNHENTPLIPKGSIIRSSAQGENGVIWIGCRDGVLKLETNSVGNPVFSKLIAEDPEINALLNDVVIHSILEDSNSRLWIGTENKGLILYDLKTQSSSKFNYADKGKYTIESNSIWSLYEDRHGTIWIGTFKHGIKKVDSREQKFEYVGANKDSKIELSYGLVSSFAEDENGNIWVGTDGGGLNFLERDKNFNITNVQKPPFRGLESHVIVSLLNDQRGRLWVGSWGKGLFRKEKNESRFEPVNYNPNKSKMVETNDIMHLFEAKSGNIWICQYRASLNLYVPSEDKFYQYEPTFSSNSLSSRNIISVIEDEDGVIWAGSANNGIDRFRLNENHEIIELKNFSVSTTTGEGASANEIEFLHLDDRNTLWAGTEGGGLKKYISNEERFETISVEDGLPSNVIYGILDDGEKLWVSTASGLASIDFETTDIKVYDTSDGLLSDEFSRAACFKTKEGTLFFGNTKGLNFFNPKNIESNSVIPDVYISGVSVRRNEQDSDFQNGLNRQMSLGEIELKANQNDLDFEFSALNYTQSGKNNYSYILEDYDNQWKNVQNTTSVSYTNIPPGDYTFKVKASNNDGIWNEKPATVKISILSPWYKTSIAYFCYFLLFAALLAGFFIAIINRERLQNQLKFEQLERTKMEELNEVKSRFFANISHEFKTPLTLIITPLNAMKRKLNKAENKNQVNVMLRNAERLNTLINQILALSKLESGTEKLKAFEFDIVDFCENIANNFHNYAEEQFISFEVKLPDHPINLYFEKDKMSKVLINLLSNAFKFTQEFGRINFTLTDDDRWVRIVVADTGIGIPEGQIEHVFERFYQAKNDRVNSAGTGIGLSLSKQLVELHKGKIEVKSVEGQGTTFEVFLPKGKKHLVESQIVEVAPLHILSEDSKNELKDFKIKGISKEVGGEVESEDSNVPVVLIAEDNPDLRAFTRTYLQTNYQIIEAENGLKAFQLAKKHIPDIVITDWMMPEMTGNELVKKLRSDEKTSHIFILMVTVKSSDESKEEGFESGVDYYITKPFNPKLLDLRIQNILKTRSKFKTQFLTKNIALSPDLPETNVISSRDNEFLNKIIAIIDENINDSKLNIDFVCKQIGFSKSQLYRKMKGVVGQSANEFIRSIRLKRAAELLLTGKFTISEVTYKVGFNDLKYFRECFKNQYQMNPSEYINQFKKTE